MKSAEEWDRWFRIHDPTIVEFIEAIRDEMRKECAEEYNQAVNNVPQETIIEQFGAWSARTYIDILNAGKG